MQSVVVVSIGERCRIWTIDGRGGRGVVFNRYPFHFVFITVCMLSDYNIISFFVSMVNMSIMNPRSNSHKLHGKFV